MEFFLQCVGFSGLELRHPVVSRDLSVVNYAMSGFGAAPIESAGI
jgi:hypothetical protein